MASQHQGLTAEMYRAVVAIVDDRMKEIRVIRQDFDRLVEAQARTEAALNRLAEAQALTEARVQALAEAQARTEEEFRRYREESEARWARIEATLNRLTEAQARTEEEFQRYREESEARWARIEATLNRLTEAQALTEARVQALAEAQARTEEEFRRYREESEARWARIEATLNRLTEAQALTEARVQALAEAQARTEAQLQRLIDREGAVEGRLLELTYQQKAGAYFGPLLRRPRALLPVDIEDQVEGHLSRDEFLDLLATDLLISGYPRHLVEAPQVWLVVEVSATVDRHDVERARRRAGLLRRAGLRAIPTVAGEDATMGARDEAETHKVLMLQDGRAFFWEEALAEALSEGPSGGAQ